MHKLIRKSLLIKNRNTKYISITRMIIIDDDLEGYQVTGALGDSLFMYIAPLIIKCFSTATTTIDLGDGKCIGFCIPS